MLDFHGSVTVIVPAYNSSATIARAVSSALAQKEVGRVVVVDDASSDNTAAVAASAGGGDERLLVLVNAANLGPSSSRNRALAQSMSPFVALLDSDDFFLEGRFRHLLQQPDFDLIADNIAFVTEDALDALDLRSLHMPGAERSLLTASAFIEGNTKSQAPQRSELGFLKPLIRRDAFERFGLAYAEEMRLGEDFVLYTRALARRARFVLDRNCGYVAIVRAGSLSGRHSAADLEAQLVADDTLLREGILDPDSVLALKTHRHMIWKKYVLRKLLDDKREGGLAFAIARGLGSPSALWHGLSGVAVDKLRANASGESQAPSNASVRYLFDAALPGIAL